MALRNLASKVGGIPALRRASAPRVSPSAGTSRPLTSGSSSYQGGCNNGARASARKPILTDEYLEKLKADFAADRAAMEEAIKEEKAHRRNLVLSAAAGVGAALLIFRYTVRGHIGKVIALDPQLLGCSIAHKLEVSVKYFRSLGIYHFVLGQMVTDFPALLLRYNTDILRLKYQYLRRVMVRPLKDLIEFPRFFSYSLEDRIEPRHRTLVANRINMKLRYMLTGSDEEFAQRVREAVERRARFEAGKGAVETFSDAPVTSEEEEAIEAAACQNSMQVD